MSNVMPTLLKVVKHFADAKQIKCLESGFVVDVTDNFNPKVVEDEITLEDHDMIIWSNGKYAKIIK